MAAGPLTSCETTKVVSIQILVPSKVSLPAEQDRFVMVNRVPMVSDSAHMDSIPAGNADIPLEYYKLLSWEAINGSIAILDQSPKLDTVMLDTMPREELTWHYGHAPPVLKPPLIQALCSRYGATGLVSLERMILKDSLGVLPVYIPDSSEVIAYYAYEFLYPGLFWRVYDCNGSLLHESTYSDTLVWDGTGSSPQEALYWLPPLEEILVEGIRYAGRIFAYDIVPTWVDVRRIYYLAGNRDMREAARYAKLNNWDAAARLWRDQAENDDPELASNAAFNMALVSEIKDRIDLALTWINKSFELKDADITRRYAQILRTRFNHRYQLSEQVQNLK
jgi:hypothetical protein